MNSNRKIIVGITQGDTNGIGYEVIIKALADARILDQFIPIVYGSSKAFAFYRNSLHDLEVPETYAINSAGEARPKKISILGCVPDSVHVEPGEPTENSAKDAHASFSRAVADLKNGEIDVLVTAPICKKSMDQLNVGYCGHAEYLRKEFGVRSTMVFMVSEDLKISVLTEHMPLRNVVSEVTKDKILEKLRMMDISLKEDFGIDRPQIGVLGLNPHCGDGGLLGEEEENIILPAVEAARAEGIEAYGPYSSDGYFGNGDFHHFDATLAMYHDQGMIPFKALAFSSGVNFTAGLPVVRTSPDHGTAFEIAGKDKADPHSMISAIFTAIDIYRNRIQFDSLMDGKMPERSLGDDRPRRPGRPQIE